VRLSRLAHWQFLLVALAGAGTVIYALVSARSEDGFNIFIAYWHGLAVATFFFVMPVIVAIGYLGGHAWARAAHFVKAGGCAYGALSVSLPSFFGGISIYWPLVLLLVLTVVIDAASLASAEVGNSGPQSR